MVEIEEEFTFDERVRRGGRAESESERVLSQSNTRNCFEVKSVSGSKNLKPYFICDSKMWPRKRM